MKRRLNDGHDLKVVGSTPIHPGLVVASSLKMLHDDFLCLVESNKQQIEKVTSKIQAQNLETKAFPKRVWIRSTHSASVFVL